MKKLTHSERIKQSGEAIKKTIQKHSKKMTKKTKKILFISGATTTSTALLATAATFIAIASTGDNRANYPILQDMFHARDFIARNPNAKQSISSKINGNQRVITAKQGPVKFISNYTELFDDQKMKDWLSWFYNDVSWGPEIASLSSVTFLSGVQSDNGQVTLGYHTTSREGSTIIMSPDVQFNWNKQIHINQSIAWALTHDKKGIRQNVKFLDDSIKDASIKQDLDPATETAYRNISAGTSFKEYVSDILVNSWRHKTADLSTSTFTTSNLTYTDLKKVDFVEYYDFIKKQFNTKNDLASKNELLKLLGFPDIKDLATAQSIFDDFVNTKLFEALFTQNQFVLSSITSNKEFNKNIVGNKGNRSIVNKIYSKSTDSYDSGYYNASTQGEIAKYQTKPKAIKKLLSQQLISANPTQYNDKQEVISAVMSPVAFYFYKNGNMGKQSLGKKESYANFVISNLYNHLNSLSRSDIIKIKGTDLFDYIYAPKSSSSEYNSKDVKSIVDLNLYTNNALSGLSKKLQNKYHPGEMVKIKGKSVRQPGFPAYHLNDNFFDAITRRVSQDMLYTVSHEYGHHTTMFYAMDLSGYNKPTQLGENKNQTAAKHDAAVINAEVLTKPGMDSMGSGYKYGLFRDAFSSKLFKDSLDISTDGYSSTDLNAQKYTDEVLLDDNIHAKTPMKLTYSDTGIGSIHQGTALTAKYISPKGSEIITEDGNEIFRSVLAQVKSQQEATDVSSSDFSAIDIKKMVVDPKTKKPTEVTITEDYSKYMTSVITSAQNEVKGLNLSYYKNVSGEILLRKTYEKVGSDTRRLFDSLFENANTMTLAKGQKTIDFSKVKDMRDKFRYYHILYSVISKAAAETIKPTPPVTPSTTTPATPTAQAKDFATFMANVKKIALDEANITLNQKVLDIVKDIYKYGGMVFEMSKDQTSISAGTYVFNKPGDSAKYKIKFSTVTSGSQPPSSFVRYTTTWAESLTRSWNQLAYTNYAELLSEAGEYYNGDQLRFLGYGEKLYSVHKGEDRKITKEGNNVEQMFEKYYNTKNLVSGMIRTRSTGQYTFYGYLPEKNNYKGLVFTDNKNNVITESDLIYNVDNFHYYKKHGDFTSITQMHKGLKSWMIEPKPLGNFKNAMLNTGNYLINFWDDKNKNNKIDKNELIKVRNKDIQLNGQLNNNGNIDGDSVIQGNPNNDKDPNKQWEIKIYDVKI